MKNYKRIIDQKIDKEIEKRLEKSDLEKEIEERTQREIEADIATETREKVKKALLEEKPIEPAQSLLSLTMSCFSGGPCRLVLFVMIFSYSLGIGGILLCRILNFSVCSSFSNIGVIVYLLSTFLLGILVSIIISIVSSQTKIGLFLLALIAFPILIFILWVTFRYLGLIIVALIIFTWFLRGRR